MKFKFIPKISVVLEKFLITSNMLRGPDIIRSGARSCTSLIYVLVLMELGR